MCLLALWLQLDRTGSSRRSLSCDSCRGVGSCTDTESTLAHPASHRAARCAQILVVEGLHPFHDERVRKLMDFHVYLDISDEVKEAWKIHRDMNERGHSEESIRASIAARKPDFDSYIDPQKKHADVIIQARLQQASDTMRACSAVGSSS